MGGCRDGERWVGKVPVETCRLLVVSVGGTGEKAEEAEGIKERMGRSSWMEASSSWWVREEAVCWAAAAASIRLFSSWVKGEVVDWAGLGGCSCSSGCGGGAVGGWVEEGLSDAAWGVAGEEAGCCWCVASSMIPRMGCVFVWMGR